MKFCRDFRKDSTSTKAQGEVEISKADTKKSSRRNPNQDMCVPEGAVDMSDAIR